MAQDSSTGSAYEQMLRNPVRLLSVRQFSSSPNLTKIDEESEEAGSAFDEPGIISSAYGSESMLDRPSEEGMAFAALYGEVESNE